MLKAKKIHEPTTPLREASSGTDLGFKTGFKIDKFKEYLNASLLLNPPLRSIKYFSKVGKRQVLSPLDSPIWVSSIASLNS